MSEVFEGRYIANPEAQSVTVFLIGMRANRWWKMGKTLRTASRMAPMLKYLMQHPESGLLGFHNWSGRTTLMLSYWKSPEHLRRFAADRDAPHLAAWREFMDSIGSGDVGIWHETYSLDDGNMEAVYGDMPKFGLANAVGHQKMTQSTRTAKQRMGAGRGSKETSG